MMAVAVRLAALALVALCGAVNSQPPYTPVEQPPPNHPMTFVLDEKSELCDKNSAFYRRAKTTGREIECAIVAEGYIDKGAVSRLHIFVSKQAELPTTILFNSGGGDLESGYLLGRAIRDLNLDTGIASTYVPAKLPDYCSDKRTPQRTREGNLDRREAELNAFICEMNRFGGVEVFGKCLSACSFAYLGGVVRTLPRNLISFDTVNAVYGYHEPSAISVEKPTQNGDSAQAVLGFHPFAPNARLDIPRAAKEQQISAWAQRQFPSMMQYLSDLGYQNQIEIIEFLTARSNPESQNRSAFNYPSRDALRDSGILPKGHFLPFEFVAEKDGAALISRFSDGLLSEKQISMACTRVDNAPPKLALIVTGGRDQQRRGGPTPRVPLTGIGEHIANPPSPASASGQSASDDLSFHYRSNPAKDLWRIVIKVDGKAILDGGQYESHPPALTGPAGELLTGSFGSRHIIFDVNDGLHYSSQNSVMPLGRDLEHFVVLISNDQIERLKSAHNIGIGYSMYGRNSVQFDLDSGFPQKVDLLLRECFSIHSPVDKVNGYDDSILD